eukprot:TRINITY_DN24771_c0_g1_i1.p1 TRINITY_DN24771_c0_g1~~TRINITY_DN24771_c0_g1_i1.p1  ORF type:complete len:455 (+),score=154.12 TRINITY_DN24771_c0_g1_i1:69-1433(+)
MLSLRRGCLAALRRAAQQRRGYFQANPQRRAGARATPYGSSGARRDARRDAPGWMDRLSNRQMIYGVIAAAIMSAGIFGGAVSHMQMTTFPDEMEAVLVDLKYVFEKFPHLRPLVIRLVVAQNQQHICNVMDNMSAANTASLRWFVKREGLEVFSQVVELMNRVQEAHRLVSVMDIWTIAACLAIEEMGGPDVLKDWQFGRIDAAVHNAVYARSLLPKMERAGESGCVQNLAESARMGLTVREHVALLGLLHEVGRTTDDLTTMNAGALDPVKAWTRDPDRITGEYFANLYHEVWDVDPEAVAFPRYTNAGPEVNWVLRLLGRKPAAPKDAADRPFPPAAPHSVVMYPADVALLQNAKTRAIVKEYARNPAAWRRDVAGAIKAIMDVNMTTYLNDPVPRSSYPSAMGYLCEVLAKKAGEGYERLVNGAGDAVRPKQPDVETVAYVKRRAAELTR